MFYISEIQYTKPTEFENELQQMVYETIEHFNIGFERVKTDEAISMDKCALIDKVLNVEIVKTLFLTNKQKSRFYLFITTPNKLFNTKDFCSALSIPRLSFATPQLLKEKTGADVGATTIFGILFNKEDDIQLILDSDILQNEWYGCSDGTTTNYLKIKMSDIMNIISHSRAQKPTIINV